MVAGAAGGLVRWLNPAMKRPMQLLLFRHLWGVAEPWEQAFPRFKSTGYHGIEATLPPAQQRKELSKLLKSYNFEFIPQIFTTGATVQEHLESFREQVQAAKTMKPRLMNAHSGKDSFNESECEQFFEGALEIEAEAAVPIAHETHRGRMLYNPWSADRLLQRFPNLKLCCDFSHWVCVCERLLEDQLPVLRRCASRCLHVHARVGYEEGPQVPDPRAPEYATHLAAHEKWWRLIWVSQKQRGFRFSTLTPEFGPPGYLHTLPFTQAPVADLSAICDWQARRQAAAFAGFIR